MLNRRGGIECDFTVSRLAEDRFGIVTGTAFGNHDSSWIRRHLPADGSVTVTDVTARWACFGLWGPRARDDPRAADCRTRSTSATCACARSPSATCPCARCASPSSASSAGSSTARPSTAPASGARCTTPASEHGLRACGYRAIDSLRLEKGYRVWAADITPDDTPLEAGLGFCVRRDKRFIGSDALASSRRGGCARSRSPSRARRARQRAGAHRGEIVGRVTSGGYGYTVGRSIAYAYLPAAVGEGSEVAIDIFGEWVPGVVAPEPLYDPSGARLRG